VPDDGDRAYVPEWADLACGFFEDLLVHTKGRYARKPFLLTDWQADDIIRPLFGTARYDGQLESWVRLYTLAWIELARKNGKSQLVAGIGLKLLVGDDEEESEIYSCAKDRDQAAVIYRAVKRIVEMSPILSKRLRVIDSKKRIVDERTGSFYQVLASDEGGNLGLNPHGILFDEVITQPSYELWLDLKSAMGTRDQPLMVAVTTAGNNPQSMAAAEHLLSEKALANPESDPSRFVFMRNMDPKADPFDERNWAYPNPALGDFLRIQPLRDEAASARSSPRLINAFLQFRCNRWVRQVTRWLSMELWDENAGLIVEAKLKGLACYTGLDLASTSDFAAMVHVFPGAVREPKGKVCDGIVCRFWLPQAAVDRRSDMRDELEAWGKTGCLMITPGDVIDYEAIKVQLDADAKMFRIEGLGYDPWNATDVVEWAKARGLTCEPVQQTTTRLNGPSKELERRLGLRQFRHGGHPVLRWMADNVQVFTDTSGNIKPDRKKSQEKIDGIAALVDALAAQQSVKKAGFAFLLDLSDEA
jgi:phage terminase large subunit-like protein